jgi:hypothetical protein
MPQLKDDTATGTAGPRWPTNAILVLTCWACVVMSGCKGSQTIWSGEATSPDGRMIATARAVANSGFAINGVGTFVYLNWTTGSQPPTLILDLADASDAPRDTNVEMKWIAPAHLELTYRGSQSLGFQALKWGGVNISVRDSSVTNAPAP